MANLVLIILDGLGIGALPDAKEYGDSGAATLQHISEAVPQFDLPGLQALGAGKIEPLTGMSKDLPAQGAYGKLASISKGKDTTTGHWELMGIVLKTPFRTFPSGFPQELLDEVGSRSGYGFIGNYPASGTEIIKQLGGEHLKTGKLIVYTSSDSVFQIAAHEERTALPELYRVCNIAREVCDNFNIARIIARPFLGENGNFVRTGSRRDFSLRPPEKTTLNYLEEAGIPTVGIGKIDDIFAGSGLIEKIHARGNHACIEATLQVMKRNTDSFIFTNLIDFDMLYGHRRDPFGYYRCLKEFDTVLPTIIKNLEQKDLLILTADHGNDPCFRGIDHTREYVPILAFSKSGRSNVNLGTRRTFADVGKTVVDFFNVNAPIAGTGFLEKIMYQENYECH